MPTITKQEKPPAFQFYYLKFLSGVKSFSTEETGAYILLLIEQWDTGFVQKNDKFLKKITGISTKKLKKVLEKFSEIEPGKLVNLMLEKVRSDQKEYRESKSCAGKSGAKKRWGKDGSVKDLPLANGWPSSSTDTLLSNDNKAEDGLQNVSRTIEAINCDSIKALIKQDQLFIEQRAMENRKSIEEVQNLIDQFFSDKRDDRATWPNESELRRNLRQWFPSYLNSKKHKDRSASNSGIIVTTGKPLQP